jgi:hypothetical protein
VNYAETTAKRVIEADVPGARMEYRSDQSRSEYDFDLRYPNGTIAAVEVTESADQLQKLISDKIRSKKEGRSVIGATKCQKSWLIFPMKNARISKIRQKADAYLSLLEQAGVERFRSLDAFNSRLFKEAGIEESLAFRVPQCVENICYDLLIDSGSIMPAGGSPKIFIQHPIGRGAVGSSVAIEAGEREAWKDDNRKKLRAAKTDERHLVVYIDVMNGLPWAALTDFEPPSTPAKMPEEITHMWLIGHGKEENEGEFVVWRATAKEPWCSHRAAVK